MRPSTVFLAATLLSPIAVPPALVAGEGSSPSSADDEVSKLIRKDAVDLKTEMEKHSMTLLKKYQFFAESKLVDDAEKALRDAIAAAPWMPGPYSLLGTHILDHGHQRHVREAMAWFAKAMRIDHALPRPKKGTTSDALMKTLHKRPSFSQHFTGQTFYGRLKHDRDQLELLGDRGRVPQGIVDRWLGGYDRLLGMVPPESQMHGMNLPANLWAKTIGGVFQRALYVPELAPLKGPALNPDLDFKKLEDTYFSSSPHFVDFDDLLTEEALLSLRRYYEEATVFWDSKPGYLGSYIFDGGFGNPVVAQLIDELMDNFPRLICDHRLNNAWAYKYDSDLASPIEIHADMASVNFNFWISPNEGNLDPEGGGLVVYRVAPPEGTPMEVFNHSPLHPNVTKMLAETGFANYTIPYKTNRAVVFQSDLFHQSGKMTWAPGYDKRRINLTLLFGNMHGKCGDSGTDTEERIPS